MLGRRSSGVRAHTHRCVEGAGWRDARFCDVRVGRLQWQLWTGSCVFTQCMRATLAPSFCSTPDVCLVWSQSAPGRASQRVPALLLLVEG